MSDQIKPIDYYRALCAAARPHEPKCIGAAFDAATYLAREGTADERRRFLAGMIADNREAGLCEDPARTVRGNLVYMAGYCDTERRAWFLGVWRPEFDLLAA